MRTVSRNESVRSSTPILLIAGGTSSTDGHFASVEPLLSPHAQLSALDPPRRGSAGAALRLRANWLAQALRRECDGPAVVVGHSLGALVSLRLAVDEPELVAGLLLLDPTPLVLGALLPKPLLKLIARARKTARLLPGRSTRAASAAIRMVPLDLRMGLFILLGGLSLAADLAAGSIQFPLTLVSADEHAPTSITRRWHCRLVDWSPEARLEVWSETTHGLHLEQPGLVADAAIKLLEMQAQSTR